MTLKIKQATTLGPLKTYGLSGWNAIAIQTNEFAAMTFNPTPGDTNL